MSGGNGASVSIIHDGKKYKKVKRFDSKETANDFMEKNKGHSVLHSDNGGVYVKHDKNKGMPHTYTPHNEETEHLDEISKDLATRAAHGFANKADNTKLPIEKRKQASSAMQLAVKKATGHGGAKVNAVSRRVEIGNHYNEAVSLKDDPSHSNNPFKYTKKPTNKKEAQGNVNYWHYVGMASNKEIEDMGENPASYKTYAKSMMQDAQRELKKMTESFELDESYETYHPSYTSAINTALDHHGHLSVSDEDRDTHIASGPRKPSEGNTVSHNIPATDKSGNPHMIHIQVYNKGGNKPFELNTYSSKVPKKKMKEEVDLDEAKTDIYHQHMLKALGKTRLPKDHPYTSAVANNGDFVVHNNGKVVGRLPKGEHSIKEELEALNELSPELLGRYANRATKDGSTSLRKIIGSTDRSTARPLITRANKRETGADMAIDKIRGNSNVKVHAKEESSLPPHLAKLIDPKTGNMKDPEKQKIYDDMMKRKMKEEAANPAQQAAIAIAKKKMKEETESDAKDNSKKFNKVFANKTQATNFAAKNGGTVKHSPLSGKYYVEVSESWLYQNEETSSVAKDATVKSTKSNVTANTNTTTPYDVKPQRVKSAEFNKLFN